MDEAIRYALLFSIPSGTALGSGLYLISREPVTGLVAGVGLGLFVFGLVYAGRAYGAPDEDRAEGP